MSDPSAQGHTNESRHIISVTECLRQDIKMLEDEIAKLREDPYAWYESAQRVNAELRTEHERRGWIIDWFNDMYPVQLSEAREYAARMMKREGS